MIRLDFELDCATARLYVFLLVFWLCIATTCIEIEIRFVIYLVVDTASVLRLWTLPFNSSCSANMGVDDLLSCTCTQVIPPTLSTSTTTMNSPAEKLFYDVEGVTCWIIQHYSGGKCVKEQPKIMHTCVATADQRKVLILNELWGARKGDEEK